LRMNKSTGPFVDSTTGGNPDTYIAPVDGGSARA